MDGPRRAGERERHLDLVRALHDLERVGHVHRPRNPRQVALELGVAVDPVGRVLVLDGPRLGRVRDPAVALDDAERAGDAAGRAEREHRGRRDLDEVERIRPLLRHHAGTRGVGLQIPVRLVVRLPDAAEIGPAVDGTDRCCPPPAPDRPRWSSTR